MGSNVKWSELKYAAVNVAAVIFGLALALAAWPVFVQKETLVVQHVSSRYALVLHDQDDTCWYTALASRGWDVYRVSLPCDGECAAGISEKRCFATVNLPVHPPGLKMPGSWRIWPDGSIETSEDTLALNLRWLFLGVGLAIAVVSSIMCVYFVLSFSLSVVVACITSIVFCHARAAMHDKAE